MPVQEYPVGIGIDKVTIDDGRAKQIVEYIRTALQKVDSIEFWKVWLMDYYEYEDRPYIHRESISIEEFTTKHIKEINDADIWNTPENVSRKTIVLLLNNNKKNKF